MAKIRFSNGQVVNFNGNPTQADVEEVAAKLGIKASTAPQAPDNRDFLQKASDFVKASPLGFTAPLGEAIGNTLYGAGEAIKQRSLEPLLQAGDQNTQNYGKVVGSAAASAALPASFAAGAPAALLEGTGAPAALASAARAFPVSAGALQYAGLGGIQSGAEALARGDSAGTAGTQAAIGAGIGGAVGGVFGLLGKVASKTAPSIASVTSGVPKTAIEQAGVNPTATKEGVGLSVPQVRERAVSSLQTLYNDLNREHNSVTSTLSDVAPAHADQISNSLIQQAQSIAKQFKVNTAIGAQGLVADFSKSAIVKGGEEKAVNKALSTISTWDDFSPQGLQTLNQRINGLKDYTEGAITKSSAIIGKIHGAISDLIQKESPELAQVNKNYATNRKVLDEISNVVGADAQTPTEVQGAVTRLDSLFKENRDQYINIIRELGKRSGVDYLSLLAGGEFQKLLPGYIRSAVAVGSVGGASAVATNPLSLLLLPLFSPRAVGVAARNAPKAAAATSKLARGAASQAIPQIASGLAPQQTR